MLLLLCAHISLASYPQRDGNCVTTYGLQSEGLMWLIGARCLHVLRGIISLCQSSATFNTVKSLSGKQRHSKYRTLLLFDWAALLKVIALFVTLMSP